MYEGSKKETGLYFENTIKKLKSYANLTKMVIYFYKKYFNMLATQWFLKFKSYSFLSVLRYSHSSKDLFCIRQNFEKNSFLFLGKILWFLL